MYATKFSSQWKSVADKLLNYCRGSKSRAVTDFYKKNSTLITAGKYFFLRFQKKFTDTLIFDGPFKNCSLSNTPSFLNYHKKCFF